MEKQNVLSVYDVLDEVIAPCVMKSEKTDGTTWKYTFVTDLMGRVRSALERHGFERDRDHEWNERIEDDFGYTIDCGGVTYLGGAWVVTMQYVGRDAWLEVGLA